MAGTLTIIAVPGHWDLCRDWEADGAGYCMRTSDGVSSVKDEVASFLVASMIGLNNGNLARTWLDNVFIAHHLLAFRFPILNNALTLHRESDLIHLTFIYLIAN